MSQKEDMHRIDIVAALHKKGIKVQDLSVECGWAPGTLSNALNRPWPKGERAIANALGMEPEDIWPSRYQKEVA